MSANVGGYLRGPWWKYIDRDDEKTRRCFVLAWGNVVKAPEEKYEDLRSVRFVIKTGRGAGRSEKHLLCVVYGDRTASVVMRAMERGDVVFLAGTWVEKMSKTKKGMRPTYECRVSIIIPMGLIGFLLDLYSTPQAQKMIEDRRNEAPDVWEE